MSIRRSRLEIMLGILAAVRGGENKPTRIMYAVHLSWNPLQKILSHMVERARAQRGNSTASRQSP